MANNHSNW